MTRFFFIFLVILCQTCLGQTKTIRDSISKNKVDSLVRSVAILWNKDLNGAEATAKEMLRYSTERNYVRGIARSYGTLAGVYENMGDSGKSLAYYIKAVDAFEALGDDVFVYKLSNNIGLLLISQREYEEARYYVERAYDYFATIDAYKNLPNIYLSLATIDINTNRSLDVIMKNLDKAEEFSIATEDTLALTLTLNLRGEAHVKNNQNLPFAISSLEKAIQLMKIKSHDDHFNLGYSYLNLGNAYLKKGTFKEALAYNDSSLIHYKAYNSYQGLRLAYQSRKEILASQGNYKESIDAFNYFNQYRDSVFKKDRTNQIVRMKTKYETDQILAEKETAEAQVALAEAVSKQNRNLFYGSLLLIGLAGLASLFFFGRVKARKKAELITIELRETQKRLALEKQYRDSELKALKAQMNPHFIFNALNSIQEYIILNQKNLAGNYLGKFADLMRKYLYHSDAGFITVQEEVESLKMYLELEALRFEDTLTYTVSIDASMNNDTIKIPTMLIQPYVENALKHGLLHRKENRKLDITFTQKQEDIILCVIEDNGVGRKRAAAIKEKANILHKSFATKATADRLQLLNFGKDKKIGVLIEDLYHEDGTAKGTKVQLQIPTLKK